MRIANRYPPQHLKTRGRCMHSSDHKRGAFFKDRSTGSFLWTIIRDPKSRMVSEFFHFAVGRNEVNPSDSNFQAYINNQNDDFISSWVAVNHMSKSVSITNAVELIVESYNFIGLVERLDESLVALQMILGLDTSYILHISAKSSGGYTTGTKGECSLIPKSFISNNMKDYFNSPQWTAKTERDVALWNAINASLDATIEHLGRHEFNKQLSKYRKYLKLTKETCSSQAIFPCGNDGTINNKTNCYRKDWGCGYECIDLLQIKD